VYEYDENENEVFIESGDGRLMNDYISREE
jgi:hypothetical protein